jgi:hypothetical protein
VLPKPDNSIRYRQCFSGIFVEEPDHPNQPYGLDLRTVSFTSVGHNVGQAASLVGGALMMRTAMKPSRAFFRKAAVYLGCIMVPLGSAYLILASVGLAPTPYTCITETRKKIPNLSGFDFEITETDCSTLGEDASISVFVSKAGGNTKTLIFKYGPAVDGLLPSIVMHNEGNLSISIPIVSDVVFQEHKWQNISIAYNIGHIDYQDVKKMTNHND